MPTQQADHKISQLSIAFEMLSPWDLVDLCLPIESYQVTKNPTFLVLTLEFYLMTFCQRESPGIIIVFVSLLL